MKKLVFALSFLLATAAMGCDKKSSGDNSSSDENLYVNSPRTAVPDELAPATWSYGTISAIGYYNDNGNHIGNAYSAAREYKVTKDGYFEFAQYLSTEGATSSCINEYFTHLKGTLKFEGNKLTFYPVEGNFKTVKTSRSAGNTSCPVSSTPRKATKEDLQNLISIYYWKTVVYDNDLYVELYKEDDPHMQGSTVFTYRIIK